MYSKIDELFWKDKKNRTLSNDEKLLFLYLLTCPHRNILGLFSMPCLYIASDLNWDKEKTEKNIKNLIDKGYIYYDFENEWVLIKNFLKYNAPENPNQIKSCAKKIDEIVATLSDELRNGLYNPFKKI